MIVVRKEHSFHKCFRRKALKSREEALKSSVVECDHSFVRSEKVFPKFLYRHISDQSKRLSNKWPISSVLSGDEESDEGQALCQETFYRFLSG